jgi:hypothetical protein
MVIILSRKTHICIFIIIVAAVSFLFIYKAQDAGAYNAGGNSGVDAGGGGVFDIAENNIAYPNTYNEYEEYVRRIENVRMEKDIAPNGFDIISAMRFPLTHKKMGKLELIPAFDRGYGRLVLFFMDGGGNIIFKTEALENNYWFPGQMSQPNDELLCVSFPDLNEDGLDDIIIITKCANGADAYPDAGEGSGAGLGGG